MRGKFVPQLDGKIGIGCAKHANEPILEPLNGLFCGVDAMIVGFNKLEAYLLWREVNFDDFRSLIVHDIYHWFVTLSRTVFKILLVCFQDAG